MNEEDILKRLDPDYKNLTANQLTDLIRKKATPEEKAFLERKKEEKMRLAVQAENLIKQGRLNRALDMLNYVVSAGSYGNEYPLGLLGDIYLQRGDKKKALEMYKKSGTIDSLKKAKKLE
jgi:predicted negative regulator of RcsB-dependent stress response